MGGEEKNCDYDVRRVIVNRPEKEANRVLWELKKGDTGPGGVWWRVHWRDLENQERKSLDSGQHSCRSLYGHVVEPTASLWVNTLPVQAFRGRH
jgi:hypothetical protein